MVVKADEWEEMQELARVADEDIASAKGILQAYCERVRVAEEKVVTESAKASAIRASLEKELDSVRKKLRACQKARDVEATQASKEYAVTNSITLKPHIMSNYAVR